MLPHKFAVMVLIFVGLVALGVNSWIHDMVGVILAFIPLAIGMVDAKIWHNKLLKEALAKARRESMDARFKIADQAAEMIVALLRVTRPHLKVVKTSYGGKSEDGRYSGAAVDVTDPIQGEWWITIESYGHARTWIGAPVGSEIKRLWKEDHNQDPARWHEILSSLISRKKVVLGINPHGEIGSIP